jgi:ribonuclease D
MIEEVLQSGIQVPPPEALNSKQRKLMANMRKCVMEKAEELSVDPALLASKRELESLIFTADGDEIPERFLGWRKAVISDELITLKEEAT